MAGRIPQDFIDDLLNRTDIADVVEERISLKRTGRNYSGLCPFHKEKSPSFSVNPEKQFYYCFGCGAGGNAIGFIMDYDRIDFPQAVDTLARRLGLEIPREAGGQSPLPQKLKDSYELLSRATEFYQQQLRHHPERDKAVTYLKGRGLSGQIAKRFQIGYAPPGWDNLISHLQNHADSPPSREAMDEAGLVILKPDEGKCYDRFRDRIMFPIIDMRGRAIAFGGRVLSDEKPKYLNSPETDTFHKNRELYGLYQARQANRELSRILIVEGYMDVVALAQYGISNAVATLGTATSEHHLSRLFKLVPEVVFCFDGDSAGRKAALRALEAALPIMEDGRQARFLFLPEGEDPDSLVRQEGREQFDQRINQAKPLSDFFFDSQSETLDLSSGEGRARLGSLTMPLIEKIPGQIFQQLMKQQLSAITGLSSEFLSQISPPPSPAASSSAASTPARPSSGGDDHGYADDYPAHHGSDYNSNHYTDNSNPYTDPYSDHDRYSPDRPSQGAAGSYDSPQRSSTRRHSAFRAGRSPDGADFRPRQTLRPSSLGARAIKTLLHYPQLALKIDFETSEALAELNDPELLLLKALVEQLRRHPQTATALILLDWHGDANYETLREIAEQELLFKDSSGLEKEFVDCLHQLVRKTEEAKLDYLKTKKLTSLSQQEKQLLTKLLIRNRAPLP